MRAAERLAPLRREPWVVLAPLVVAQWIAVAVFTTFVNHNGWLFYQGGDQTWFYTSSWVVADGHIPQTFVGWVWPLVLTPIAAVAGSSFLAGLPAVVVLQFVVLLPLGLLLAYAIAARLGGRLLGYWAAGWWIAAPFAVIPLFVGRYHDTYVDQTLPQALGLTGLGDFPSMIAVLAAAFLVVRALETDASADALAAGLLAGLAIGVKPSNGLFLFAPLVAFAVARRWQGAGVFVLALVPALVVLAVWKHRGTGIALLASEGIRLAAGVDTPDFSPPTFWERVREYVPLDRNQLNRHFLLFREYFWSARLLEYLPLAGLLATARRSLPIASLFAVWLATFFLVKGSSPAVDVESGSIWRLLMPAWPAYFLLGASLPLLVPRWGMYLADRFHGPARPLALGRRGFASIVALAFGVPAVAFLALPSDDTARAGLIPSRSLFLPIDGSFRVTGRTLDGGVLELTWPRPANASARPFYVILRQPTRSVFPGTTDPVVQGLRCRDPGAAIRCTIEMTEVARQRSRIYRERPPEGSWTYRIGLAANWLDDPAQGDVMVVSAPLDVAVR